MKISFQTDSKKTEVLKGKSERIGQQEMYNTQKVERNCSGRSRSRSETWIDSKEKIVLNTRNTCVNMTYFSLLF
jgi:hypothetical protein